jgi:hypothetical protein
MNAEQMMDHAFAHGVITTLDRHAGGWTAMVTDEECHQSTKIAKHGRDAMEQALCTVSFEWEDKDRAAAFRIALCHGMKETG